MNSKQKDLAVGNRGDFFAASQRGGIAGGHMNTNKHPISNENMQERFKNLQGRLNTSLRPQDCTSSLMELGEIEKKLASLQREVKSLKGLFEARRTILNNPVDQRGKGTDSVTGKEKLTT
ncbi:hypothetical protein AB1N83_004641 [Pleurotus pulmonarius]